MATNAITVAGLLIVLAVFASYLAMLFVVHRFTYRTWVFHAAVMAGMSLALVGVAVGGNAGLSVLVLVLGAAWFVVTWRELGIRGSRAMKLHVGDAMPEFRALTTDGTVVTQADLVDAAPTVLVLYRGWWCPSSRTQLDDLHSHAAGLSGLGTTVFAGSVDSPEESAPMQEYIGTDITILCSIEAAFLEAIGVRDERGAPWYDRLRFGATQQPIAMPAALALNSAGRVVFAQRSTRVDGRPDPVALIDSVAAAQRSAAPA